MGVEAVAVDATQQVWVAWIETPEDELGGRVRIARWNGSTWVDIGREALDKVIDAQGSTMMRELSLAIDTKGHAWLIRLAAKRPRGSGLALARWDGAAWTDVPAPRGPEGKDATAWSASMILRNGVPLVAWSQSDATDNHHLFVAEWTAGDRWTTRLSDLHFVEGVSNVTDVRLAARDNRSFFVSWDEPARGQSPTRLIEAYPCRAGERPAAPPKSTVERDTWPTTVDEAAKGIVASMDEESKARVRATKKDDLGQYHHGWGMGIRNSLGLWRGNDKLRESCGRGGKVHPDFCSSVIIEAVWTLLQTAKQ